MPEENLVVFVTASTEEEARVIADALLEERLVACANLVPSVVSLFRWKGKVERESEVLMILKTRRRLLDRLSERVRELHSYEIPEVVALPIVGGSKPYLDWIKEETESPPRLQPRDRRGPFGQGF